MTKGIIYKHKTAEEVPSGGRLGSHVKANSWLPHLRGRREAAGSTGGFPCHIWNAILGLPWGVALKWAKHVNQNGLSLWIFVLVAFDQAQWFALTYLQWYQTAATWSTTDMHKWPCLLHTAPHHHGPPQGHKGSIGSSHWPVRWNSPSVQMHIYEDENLYASIWNCRNPSVVTCQTSFGQSCCPNSGWKILFEPPPSLLPSFLTLLLFLSPQELWSFFLFFWKEMTFLSAALKCSSSRLRWIYDVLSTSKGNERCESMLNMFSYFPP